MKYFFIGAALIISTTIIAQQTNVHITELNGIGVNIASPVKYFQLEIPATYMNDGLYSKINYTGIADIKAIEGNSEINPGYGIGGYFTGGYQGIYARANGGNYNGGGFALYGVYAESTGTTGTRIGIFGQASGGNKNFAARFGNGDVDIHNNTYIGKPTDSLARLHVYNLNKLHNGVARAGYFKTSHNGNEDAYGITSTATSNGTGKVYGMYSTAIGSSGEMIGLFSSASGGSLNLAALFGPGDVEVQNRLRINTTAQNGRVHIKNTDNIGSNATALRIEATNNGTETAYGTFVTASNAGTGTAIGHYSIVYSDEDLAYRGDGNVYFTGDLRVGQNVDPYMGDYKVVIDGKVLAEEVRVQNSLDWPDYVFNKSYNLKSLHEVEDFIKENNHLPNIPSATEIEENGIILGEMQTRMMEKIEELTLYLIQQEKRINQLENQLKTVRDEE